ncbi:MAG: N-acetylmuramoyl-L-alanine amidase [Thermoleophilia bacterium]|nr:N-acetylmuramoyl-L-alanine amidase [Thermoleophilia bacterium]
MTRRPPKQNVAGQLISQLKAERAARAAAQRRRRALVALRIVAGFGVVVIAAIGIYLTVRPTADKTRGKSGTTAQQNTTDNSPNTLVLPPKTDTTTSADSATDTTTTATTATTSKPMRDKFGDATDALKIIGVVPRLIPYDAVRRNEMAAYSQRHYGSSSATLDPTLIVLHFTATTFDPYGSFAADEPAAGPAGSTKELPGTCAHFVVLQNGTVEQLVPLNLMCRHTIGLNDQAIGIEMVEKTSANAIFTRPAQIAAALKLVDTLSTTLDIDRAHVIGHAAANGYPTFHDLAGWQNDHTDWNAAQVQRHRKLLPKPAAT